VLCWALLCFVCLSAQRGGWAAGPWVNWLCGIRDAEADALYMPEAAASAGRLSRSSLRLSSSPVVKLGRPVIVRATVHRH